MLRYKIQDRKIIIDVVPEEDVVDGLMIRVPDSKVPKEILPFFSTDLKKGQVEYPLPVSFEENDVISVSILLKNE